jgi:hypothetical protein
MIPFLRLDSLQRSAPTQRWRRRLLECAGQIVARLATAALTNGRIMSQTSIRTRAASISVLLAVSCGTSFSPDEVARNFWEAKQSGDLELAATFVTDESLRLLDDGVLPDTMEKILFGEVLRNESAAVVRTSMLTRADDIDLNIVFHTHLVLEDDDWRVDLVATQQEVSNATFSAGMKFVGQAVGQGIEEFGQALEQGAAEVRDAIRDAIEELGKAEGEAL